jgi:PAS domain S-box-containing protein
MKREETTSQDLLITELNALRQQLVAPEERLGEPITIDETTQSHDSDASLISASAEQHQSILEAAPEAIIAVDNNGQIVLTNSKAQTLFGYDQAEILGETIELLIPEHLHEAHVKHRQGYQTDPSTRPMGVRQRLVGWRKDGTEIPLKIGLSFTRLQSSEIKPDQVESDSLLTIAMIAEANRSELYDANDASSIGALISTKMQPPRLTSDHIPRPRLFEYHDNMTIEIEAGSMKRPLTTLTGRVSDQAALQGMLSLLYDDMQLPLVSVEWLPEDQ